MARQHRKAADRQWTGSHLVDRMLDGVWRILNQEFERRRQSPTP
jgi:hypothetical protein